MRSRGPGFDELVAGAKDGDPRPAPHADVGEVGTGRRDHGPRIEAATGVEQRVASTEIGTALADVTRR